MSPSDHLFTLTPTRRINVGRDFQADIPPIQERQDAYSDSHNALLLWTVQDELQHPNNQLRSKTLSVNINLPDDHRTISLTACFLFLVKLKLW